MGDIGEGQKTYEVEPIEHPIEEPVVAPEPEKEPVPAYE